MYKKKGNQYRCTNTYLSPKVIGLQGVDAGHCGAQILADLAKFRRKQPGNGLLPGQIHRNVRSVVRALEPRPLLKEE